MVKYENTTLHKYLGRFKAKEHSPLAYVFKFRGKPVVGLISRAMFGNFIFEELRIRPINGKHSIGNGAGMDVYKYFKREAKC
jgi:hypothetical protein